MTLGRTRTRSALADQVPREHVDLPLGLAELFGNDLDSYAEIISGPGGTVAGFMTRGEDDQFSERVHIAFRELGLGARAWEHYLALATWFEHKRIFLKLEWHRTAHGIEPLAACYFRRRPEVAEALERLAGLGAGPTAVQRAKDLAGALEKTSIHFVSAAFRPDRPAHHKLYFSQLVDPTKREVGLARVERVFELFGVRGDARERWRDLHDPTLGIGERTFFVSTSFCGDDVAPSFKLDYPDVSPGRAAAWRPIAERAAITRDAGEACRRAGIAALSFLGARFAPGEVAPALKYYADVPIPIPL